MYLYNIEDIVGLKYNAMEKEETLDLLPSR